jgi:hypothetical protein
MEMSGHFTRRERASVLIEYEVVWAIEKKLPLPGIKLQFPLSHYTV